MSFGLDVLSRLQGRTEINSNGCWLYSKTGKQPRYPQLRVEGRLRAAHRLSASHFLGLDLNDNSKVVMHICDETKCWNPSHLRIGTQKENVQDCADKKRDVGSKKTHCKLGHPLSGENLIIRQRRRICLTCRRRNDAALKRKTRRLSNFYR